MVKGRPKKSQIRQNIVEILFFKKRAYGYEIANIYKQIFPACTQRSIYYHLKTGVTLKEFKINEIKKEEGDFSWGSTVEKIYYELGPLAKPQMDKRVKKYFSKK